MSEFARPYDLRHLPTGAHQLEASAGECAALARRFGLVRVDHLRASVTLIPDGAAVRVEGRLDAAIVQSCAVSGEDLPAKIAEPLSFRFVPPLQPGSPDEERELTADELDEIEMEAQGSFDLGEALAQSMALAIDPFAAGPHAEEARRKAGLLNPDQTGPFAALAALKKHGD